MCLGTHAHIWGCQNTAEIFHMKCNYTARNGTLLVGTSSLSYRCMSRKVLALWRERLSRRITCNWWLADKLLLSAMPKHASGSGAFAKTTLNVNLPRPQDWDSSSALLSSPPALPLLHLHQDAAGRIRLWLQMRPQHLVTVMPIAPWALV